MLQGENDWSILWNSFLNFELAITGRAIANHEHLVEIASSKCLARGSKKNTRCLFSPQRVLWTKICSYNEWGFSFLCVFSRLDELNTTRATFKERARELEEEIAVLRSRTNSTQQVSFWTNYPCSCGKDVNKFCWLYPIALRVQVDHSSTMVINQKVGMGNWVSTRSGCQRGSQSFWTTNGEFGFPCSCRWRSSVHHCLQVLKDLLQWRIHETICFNNWNIL